jgi:hypothetical protein
LKFARNVFLFAGCYGLVVIVPMYFSEAQLNVDFPPAINHPEYFYGFIGVTMAWQLAFLVIARDVVRYRLMMIPAVVEKFSYAAAGLHLYVSGRTPSAIAVAATFDLALGILFLAAFFTTKQKSLS